MKEETKRKKRKKGERIKLKHKKCDEMYGIPNGKLICESMKLKEFKH